MEGKYVMCFQSLSPSVKTPMLARLIEETTGGRCVVIINKREFKVHRGACSTEPFVPTLAEMYAPLRIVDPISGVEPIHEAPKKSQRENSE